MEPSKNEIEAQLSAVQASQMAVMIAAGQFDLIKQLGWTIYHSEPYQYLRSNLITRDPAMLQAIEDAALICVHTYLEKSTVLILGESGTGKETFARSFAKIKDKLGRPVPFVGINCTSLPDYLVESELFGHKKGSFTGAIDDRIGLMVRAGDGVLFIDEIGDMPLSLQPKLLRAIQERKVRPVGSNEEIQINCRVVCATQANVKNIRPDLYYRISQYEIHIPPLRDRPNDIIMYLDHHGIKDYKGFGLLVSLWAESGAPGNYRGLQQIIARRQLQTWRDTAKEK